MSDSCVCMIPPWIAIDAIWKQWQFLGLDGKIPQAVSQFPSQEYHKLLIGSLLPVTFLVTNISDAAPVL